MILARRRVGCNLFSRYKGVNEIMGMFVKSLYGIYFEEKIGYTLRHLDKVPNTIVTIL